MRGSRVIYHDCRPSFSYSFTGCLLDDPHRDSMLDKSQPKDQARASTTNLSRKISRLRRDSGQSGVRSILKTVSLLTSFEGNLEWQGG